MKKISQDQVQQFVSFLKTYQKDLASRIAEVNGAEAVTFTDWSRSPEESSVIREGGGTMGVLRGKVVEKAGVNFSQVYGDSYPALGGDDSGEDSDDLKGKPFMATGVSSICHMLNPFAPIGHMNVRLIQVGDVFWFGGGADMTPFHPYEEDTLAFHNAMKKACEVLDSSHALPGNEKSYEKFSRWCDEYFYIPHWKSIRGVGGIFFDHLKGEFEELFPFIQAVAYAYKDAYPDVIEKRKNSPYSHEDKEKHLYWRGRYAEFNLVYDRGTRFGLMTGGNPEAIFVSLPPVVKW